MTSAATDEARAFNADLEERLGELPPPWSFPIDQVRQARREGKGVFPPPTFRDHARWHEIDGPTGPIRLRIVAPQTREATGAYLHIHGGGWTLGTADEQDVRLEELAEATGLAAVSVEYRLAPEHPHPAGPDDCEAAARWLLGGGAGELGVPALFAIGGESAGAHLSALTLLRLRARGEDGFSVANLVFGAFDLSITPSARAWGDTNLVLSTPIIEWFGDQYLPGVGAEERRDPAVSPLYADLSGLPPALFTIGTRDPLLDDSLFMAARWAHAGNESELDVIDEAIHAFNYFDLEITRRSTERQSAFLRAALGVRR
ncbi:MAG: alpha/beta hydrolase [Actinomycetota bacterium]|nr:alpha/beta hydrolase [Actinomycetota bacterium]